MSSVTRGRGGWLRWIASLGTLAVLMASLATIARADIVKWEWKRSLDGYDLYDVKYGDGQFIAVGTQGKLFASKDGISWEQGTSGTGLKLTALTYGKDLWVAVGEQGKIIISDDGRSWKHPATSTFRLLKSVTYGNGTYVAVGAAGHSMASANGRDWVNQLTGTNFMLNSITYANGRFVAVGAGGTIITSTDAKSWSVWDRPRDLVDAELNAVVYANGKFVAVGDGSIILTSEDGLQWSKEASPGPYWLKGVTTGRNQVVAVGNSGAVYTSSDAVKWQVASAMSPDVNLTAVVFGQDRFVAVGLGKVLFFESPCGNVFADVPNSIPACQAVELLARSGVVKGYTDGKFHPENNVTRAEFAKMIVATLSRPPEPNGKLSFSDVAGHWAATQGYLQVAVKINAVSGFPDGTFQPELFVTRSQVVKIVAAAAGYQPAGLPVYSDIPPQAWYAGWVAEAHTQKLIGPQGETPLWTTFAFDGEREVTRAEAAVILANLLSLKR